eukprot:CAMPEP_0113492194 /NCGR_PEP_ID=MMETSP0014_2-20120614/27947_1 /TAXON_ID=2857 /ORGANISM="Nitzschia sp." /LENGTH=557 /DNA_ID=CAMNT_0000386011 /DNA_START=111 /DNA_END=1783 /DNA_ORIENTATION=+ /assembly_acc=CAM_ASM_000159
MSIEEWSNFCASVFAYKKPNPPPPFVLLQPLHERDPDRVSPSLIRVATTTTTSSTETDDVVHRPPQEIVASVRIFLRRLSIGKKLPSSSSSSPSAPTSSFIWAGGIGEVCTSEEHRRRGLSRRLLETAIEMMKELPWLDVSLLHAGPTFQPVYEKFGYVSTRTNWSKLRIKCTVLKQKYCDLVVLQMTDRREGRAAVDDNDDDDISRQTPVTAYSVRQASFPEDTTRLMELHQRFSEQRLRGCIVRTEEYWNDYMSVELDKSLFVLVQEDFVGTVNDDKNIQQDQDQDDAVELDKSLFVLVQEDFVRSVVNDHNNNNNVQQDQDQDDDDDDENGINSSSCSSSSSKRIIAWLSIRPRGEDYYQLREFGMDMEETNPDPRCCCTPNTNRQTIPRIKIKTFDAMCILLAHALDFSRAEEEEEEEVETSTATDRNRSDSRNTDEASIISLLVPQFVMDEIKSQAVVATDIDGGVDDDDTNTNTNTSTDKDDDNAGDDCDHTDDNTVIDRGWMYLNLSNSPAATEYLQNLQQDHQSSMTTNRSHHQHQQHHSHMIWPSDSF